MRIRELFWGDHTEDHLARHGVTIQEVEEVCYGRFLMIRSGRKRKAVLGQSDAGRYLIVILDEADYGEFDVVTARDMNQPERRRYQFWKGVH